MTPVTWSVTFFRPHTGPEAAKLCAIVWREHEPFDLMVVGVWRRRLRWLPTWWPFNMRFDDDRISQFEAMEALRTWCTSHNAKEAQKAANLTTPAHIALERARRTT